MLRRGLHTVSAGLPCIGWAVSGGLDPTAQASDPRYSAAHRRTRLNPTATVALAFGLGSREIARSLSAARYARADFSVGETVRVGELRGRIERIDSAATVLRVGDDRIRVPNRVLIEGVVTVEERAGESM